MKFLTLSFFSLAILALVLAQSIEAAPAPKSKEDAGKEKEDKNRYKDRAPIGLSNGLFVKNQSGSAGKASN